MTTNTINKIIEIEKILEKIKNEGTIHRFYVNTFSHITLQSDENFEFHTPIEYLNISIYENDRTDYPVRIETLIGDTALDIFKEGLYNVLTKKFKK